MGMYKWHHVTRGILGFAIGSPVGTRQGNTQKSQKMRSRPNLAANNINRPQKQPIKGLVTGNTLALRLTRHRRLMLNCSNIFFGISDHFAGRNRTVQRLTTSERMVWYNPRSVHCAILSMTSPTWLGRCHTHGIRRMGSSKQREEASSP